MSTQASKIGKTSVSLKYDNILHWLFDGDDVRSTSMAGITSNRFVENFDGNKLAYIILNPEVIPKRPGARDSVPLELYFDEADFITSEGASHTITRYRQSPLKIGRCLSSNRGQGMLREARYIIFYDYYKDYDIANCHPVLLSQLLKAMNIPHPNLEYYIENRKECLQEFMDRGISRDEAKRKFLVATYGAGDKTLLDGGVTERFVDFVKEVRGIAEYMRTHFAGIESRISDYKAKQANRKAGRTSKCDYLTDGCILSYICQHMEANVMAVMFNCLKKVDKKLALQSIIQHDGCMIPKDLDHVAWMKLCHNALKEKGVSVNIEYKPFERVELHGYDPSVNYVAMISRGGKGCVNATSCFDPEDHYYFHDFIAGITSIRPGQSAHVYTMHYIMDNFDRCVKIVGHNMFYTRENDETIEMCTGIPQHWSQFYIWVCVDGGSAQVTFSNFYARNRYLFGRLKSLNHLWNDSHSEKLQLKPRFLGIPNGERDMAKLEIFKKHTLDVICAGHMENYMYLMSWLAHCFYRPNIKSQKIIIISGGQGSGKSLWFNIISRSLFGSQVCLENVQGLQGLLDKDNYRFLNKKLLCVNELIQWDGNTASNLGRLKDFVTEDEISVKKMYCNVRVEKAYYELIGLSNHDDVIRLEQSDRRFFMLKTDDKYIGNAEYFKALHSCISCPELGNALAYELKAHLVDGFEQIRPPMTSIKREVLEISSGYVREFTEAVIEAGEKGLFLYAPDKDGWYVSTHELYKKYCEENGYRPRDWKLSAKKSLENIGWTFKRTSVTTIGKPPATISSA